MTLGLVMTWNGSSSSGIDGLVIEKVDRGAFGDVLDQELQMAGRDGAWVFGDARGNRTIRVKGQVIRGIDERRNGVSEFARFLNVSGYADLKFSDETDRYWRAFLKTAPQPDEWRRQGKFVLEFRAEPYAYSVTTSSTPVTASTAAGSSGTLNVPDDLPACPVIEITPLDGTITSYVLGIETYSLTVSASIPSGQTQTVSTCSYTITGGTNGETELTGAYDASPHWTVDASGEFPLLVAGDNDWTFSWAGTATKVRLRFYWRERLY